MTDPLYQMNSNWLLCSATSASPVIVGAAKTEKVDGVFTQNTVFLRLTQPGIRPHTGPQRLLPKRKRIVRSIHYSLRSQDVGQQFQGMVTEYGRIDMDSVHIFRGGTRTIFADDIAMAPGVVDPAKQKGKTTAAMGETKLE